MKRGNDTSYGNRDSGALLWLSVAALEWSSNEMEEPLARPIQPWICLVGAVALVLTGVFGVSINVGWLTTTVFAIILIQAGLDGRARLRRPELY